MSKIKKIKVNNQTIYDLKKYSAKNNQKLYIDKISENGIVKALSNKYYKLFKVNHNINFSLINDIVKKYNFKATIYVMDSEVYLLVNNIFEKFEIAESNFNELENVIKHQVKNEGIEFVSIKGNELIDTINKFYLLNTKTEKLQLNENDIEKLFTYEYEDTNLNFVKKNLNVYETLFVQKYSTETKTKDLIKEFLKHKENIKIIKIELSYINTKDYSNLVNDCYLDANARSSSIEDIYDFSYKTTPNYTTSKLNDDKYLFSLSFVLTDSSETELKNRIESIDISFAYAGAILGNIHNSIINNKVLMFTPIESERLNTSYERVVSENIASIIINLFFEEK